jgi:uncharacterized protein
VHDETQNTELTTAIAAGDEAAVRRLVDTRPDLVRGDGAAAPPLHTALRLGHTTIAVLLLSRGASLRARDDDGLTGLQRLGRHGTPALGEVLLFHWAGLGLKHRLGGQLFLHAALWGNTEFAAYLASVGVPRNAGDADGATALHHAVTRGHCDYARWLLALGADPRVADRDGVCPAELASARGDRALADELGRVGIRLAQAELRRAAAERRHTEAGAVGRPGGPIPPRPAAQVRIRAR